MPKIIEFEGKEIEVPDDATDEEVAGILAQYAPTQTATLPESMEERWLANRNAPPVPEREGLGDLGSEAVPERARDTEANRAANRLDFANELLAREADDEKRGLTRSWRTKPFTQEDLAPRHGGSNVDDYLERRLAELGTREEAVEREYQKNPLLEKVNVYADAVLRGVGIKAAIEAAGGRQTPFDAEVQARARQDLGTVGRGAATLTELASAALPISRGAALLKPLGPAAGPLALGGYSALTARGKDGGPPTLSERAMAGVEGTAMGAIAAPIHRVLGGARPGPARDVLAGAGSFAGAGTATRALFGHEAAGDEQTAEEAVFGGILTALGLPAAVRARRVAAFREMRPEARQRLLERYQARQDANPIGRTDKIPVAAENRPGYVPPVAEKVPVSAHAETPPVAPTGVPSALARTPADVGVPMAPKAAPKGKSLSQYVRSQGGIRAGEEWSGEVEMLSRKETGSTGLLRRNGGMTPEEAKQSAKEAGFDVDRLTPSEFIDAVMRDATKQEAFRTPEDMRAEGEALSEPQPVGPEAPKIDPFVTGTKNAVVNEERVARGEEPLSKGAPFTNEAALSAARQKMAENPRYQQDLVRDLIERPRAPSNVEDAALKMLSVDLNRARKQADAAGIEAQARGDMDGVQAAKEAVERIRVEFDDLNEATRLGGQEWGRGGQMRQRMMMDDYSLLEMERKVRREQDYKPLSSEQAERVKVLHEQVERLTKERDAYAQLREGREERVRKGYGSTNRIVTQAAYLEAVARFKARASQVNINIDPAMLVEAVKIGVYHLEAGTRSFARWAKKMSETLGDVDERRLHDIYREARKQIPQMKREMTREQRIEQAIDATERTITEYEQRLEGGARKPGKTPLTDPRLDALRARRDALKERLNPRLEAYKTRTERAAERYERGEGPKERVPIHKDAKAVALEARLQAAKERFHELVFKAKLANRTKVQKAAAIPVEAANLTRAIMTSMDLSAVGRQGWLLALAHPIKAARAIPGMLKAFASKAARDKAEAEIRLRPTYAEAKKAGLYLAEHGATSLSKMEEAYMSRWADRVPLVAGSQRAYTTFLNRLRMDVYDTLAGNLSRSGRATPQEARAIANYVNVMSGRGSMRASAAMAGLNTVFFSPRLLASRFQVLAGQPLYGGTARTRTLVAKEYARILVGMSMVYALAKIAFGADVETDARSSDFGKLRFGNSRLDPGGGLIQPTVLTARLATGETKSVSSGKVYPIRGEKARTDSFDVLARFLRTKLAPVIGASVNVAAGENVVGEKATVGSEAAGLVTPMAPRDVYEAMVEQGVPKGSALGILSLFGFGLQTFKARK